MAKINQSVLVDVVTDDLKNNEFVLYFLENGPWPTTPDEWGPVLKRIQDRILDAADAAIDGGVAARFPESRGRNFRIQIDSPAGVPKELEDLVIAVRRYLGTSEEYVEAIDKSSFVGRLRLVTGAEMGRFETPKSLR